MSHAYKSENDGSFSKILSNSEALKTIKFTFWGFIILAVLQSFFIVVLARGHPVLFMFIEPALFALMAVIMKLTKSIVAAIILLVLVGIELLMQIILMFYTGAPAFGNLVIPAVLAWLSIRAIQSTSFLRKHKEDDPAK